MVTVCLVLRVTHCFEPLGKGQGVAVVTVLRDAIEPSCRVPGQPAIYRGNRSLAGTPRAVTVCSGTVHQVPSDLRKALVNDDTARATWHDTTPLARNEWICWVVDAKGDDTRQRRIKRTSTELAKPSSAGGSGTAGP